jgi:hypothetical protein
LFAEFYGPDWDGKVHTESGTTISRVEAYRIKHVLEYEDSISVTTMVERFGVSKGTVKKIAEKCGLTHKLEFRGSEL